MFPYREEEEEYGDEYVIFLEDDVEEEEEEEEEAEEEEEEEYGEEYDIFLSFHGEDIRKGFIDHLYIRLTDAGFSVFKDDVNLPVGEEIAVSLPKAIKKSKIAMPILSENYAASKWCMMELFYMMECRKAMGLKVIPIFYDVTPSQVRHLRGSYRTAFLEHFEKYDSETVYVWGKALSDVASIKGLELATDTAGCEGQFTKLIVATVSHELYKSAEITRLLDMGAPDKKMVVVSGSVRSGMKIMSVKLLRKVRHRISLLQHCLER